MKSGLDNPVFSETEERTILKDSNFPIEVFPQTVQDIILDLNKAQGLPVDFIAGSMLFAVSAAIGNTSIAYLKKDTIASALIYIALVGRPGTGKSYPLDWILTPLRHRDLEDYKTFIEKYKRFSDGEIEKPIQSRLLVSDVTKEKLNLIHSQNPRGLGLVCDELLSFYNNINRYHKGDDKVYYLSNWSSKREPVDRMSDEMPQNDFKQYISIAGTIQPNLIGEFLKGYNSVNGWFDRWLFAYPKSQKFARLSRIEIQDKTIKNWANIIFKILNTPFEVDTKPKVLRYDEKAYNTFFDWFETNADIVDNKPDGPLFQLQGKFSIYAQRLTLILETLDWASGTGSGLEIKESSMLRGIKLTEYYRDISLNLWKDHFLKYPKKQSKKDEFIENLPDKFNTSEAEKIGLEVGVERKTVFNYLKDNRIKKLKHNSYIKNFENGTAA